jgi:hypothetical protein
MSIRGLAKAAAVGVGAGVAVSSRLVDFALIGSAVAAAVGSAGFAGLMVMRGDHAPDVNGMQYLAIFAQPARAPRPASTLPQVAAAPQPTPTPSFDMAPTGAISPKDSLEIGEYELVSAKPDRAWLRSGPRIIAVHPGDDVPRLGKVKEIAWSDGHWSLIGESGAALLSSGEAAAPPSQRAPALTQKRMIFDEGR